MDRELATRALNLLGIDAVCDKIVEGCPYTEIAGSVGVSKSTFIRWLADDADRSARAKQAMQLSAATFDEMAEAEIKLAQTPFDLSKAKEIAHHYRWRAAKRHPQQFSEKVQQEVTGKDGAPLEMNVTTNLSDDDLNARIAALLPKT